MKNLCKATFYRMYKSAGIRAAFLLMLFAAVIYYVLAYQVATGGLAKESAGTVTALGDAMLLWICAPLSAGLLVGSDFEHKTIHGAIGWGRGRILLQYLLVFAVGVVLLLLPYLLGSVICLLTGVDMTGAEAVSVSVCMDNVLYGSNYGAGKLLLSYIAFVAVSVGQLSICIPVALKVKKPVIVTAFGFFFGMITALLASLASESKIGDTIYRLTPYAYRVSAENSISRLLSGILVSIIFTGLMGGIAWLLFRRAEIK